jgi:CRISPR-associated endonuclease Csn1
VHHPALMTDAARAAIRNAIFHQRPLKPVKPGRCTFLPETDERAPAALPSVQARIVYETVNALRYGQGLSKTTPLTRVQRDLVTGALLTGRGLTFARIRKDLKLGDVVFSLEDVRDELKGADTAKKLSDAKAFDKAWHDLAPAVQDQIVELLLAEEDEETLVTRLCAEYGIADANARYVANVPLADGYARLGRTANARVLEQLKTDVVVYSEACVRAGFHHSDFRDGIVHDRLPPYQLILERQIGFGTGERNLRKDARLGRNKNGPIPDDFDVRLGRVANPTVHIGLNQLRRVTNALIDAYGAPAEIVVELARDLKQSTDEKRDALRRNQKNQKANEARAAKLAELGLDARGENLVRIRLWEEQTVDGVARCPYTLQPISLAMLFSADVEIDHILPVSQTLDDSGANKVVALRAANRLKRNRTPFEAFSNSAPSPIAAWADIEANAAALPRNKAWRFAPDAMERFNKIGDFLDRQLNETRYLARLAKGYLSALTEDVWVVTGQLTSLLRGKWGLNSVLTDDNRKNRNDHRHHAIDAIVVACTSRSLLQAVAKRVARAEEQDLEKLFSEFPVPMPDFREQAAAVVRDVVVSHKADHGKGGALHEETAYGIVTGPDAAIGNLVFRRPLDSLRPGEVKKVRCPRLRAAFANVAADAADQKAFTAALLTWAKAEAEAISERTGRPRQPMRRVRMLKPKEPVIQLAPRAGGTPYKALVPGKNWCVDIVQMRDGKWRGFGASVFEANQPGWRPEWERGKLGGKLVMRLHKGDLIELDDDDGRRVVKRIVQISPVNGRVLLAGHNEAGALRDRNNAPDTEDAFSWDSSVWSSLKARNAIAVRIDELGRVAKRKSNIAS